MGNDNSLVSVVRSSRVYLYFSRYPEAHMLWRSVNAMVLVFVTAAILFGLASFLVSGTDLWDGVLVSHSVNVERPDVYHEWFSEAGLFFTPFIYDAIYLFRGFVNYEFTARLLTILFLACAAIEVSRLATRYFFVDDKVGLAVAVLFYLSPAWVLYHSTIYLMHSLAVFVTLVSTRFILERRYVWASFPLLLLSFQQSSNAPLAISLVLMSCCFGQVKRSNVIYSIVVCLFVVVGFFALRKIFPTYGLYADYNKISLESIFSVKSYFKFLNFFIVSYISLFVACVVALALNPSARGFFKFSVLAAALLLNAVPYVAVGKLPFLWEIGLMHGESLRFVFTSTVVAVLFLPLMWKTLEAWPRLRLVLVAAVFLQASFTNIYAHEGKIKEILVQRGMVNELKAIKEFPACVVQISTHGFSALTGYEYGDIFYKAYGRNDQLLVNAKPNVAEEVSKVYEALNTERYKQKYFIPQQSPECVVDMSVSTNVSKLPFFSAVTKYFLLRNEGLVDISVSTVRPLQ